MDITTNGGCLGIVKLCVGLVASPRLRQFEVRGFLKLGSIWVIAWVVAPMEARRKFEIQLFQADG